MLTRPLLALALCLPLTSCGGGDDDDCAQPTPEAVPDFVRATVRLTDAGASAPLEGVAVTLDDQEELTDGTGRADLTVATLAPFELAVDAGPDYSEYRLAGLVGGDDFIFQTLISSRALTDLVYDGLGLVADPAKGTLVVSLDTIALQAATGASASIDAASDDPFIFRHGVAEPGSELIFEAEAFVSFPNVDPGELTVTIAPPANDVCLSFPALEVDDLRTFEVYADTVTVVTFICQ